MGLTWARKTTTLFTAGETGRPVSQCLTAGVTSSLMGRRQGRRSAIGRGRRQARWSGVGATSSAMGRRRGRYKSRRGGPRRLGPNAPRACTDPRRLACSPRLPRFPIKAPMRKQGANAAASKSTTTTTSWPHKAGGREVSPPASVRTRKASRTLLFEVDGLTRGSAVERHEHRRIDVSRNLTDMPVGKDVHHDSTRVVARCAESHAVSIGAPLS